MARAQNFCDPFSIRSLLTLPALDDDTSSAWHLSAFEKSLTSTTFLLDEPQDEKPESLKTDLFCLNLDDVSLPDLDSTTDSAVATDAEGGEPHSAAYGSGIEIEGDFWSLPDVARGTCAVGLLSWDNFLEKIDPRPKPAYLSETETGIFGQLLHSSTRNSDQTVPRHAKPNSFLSSLRELSVGRESVFFSYDDENAAFKARYDNYTLLDIGVDIMDSLVLGFLQLGNDMRALRAFVEKESVSPRHRMRKALSAAIDTAIFALETNFEASRFAMMSLLQMQETIKRPSIVVASLRTLTKHCSEDTGSMPSLVQICDTLGSEHPWLRGALQEVVRRCASSQIEAINQSLGLGTTFVYSNISVDKSTTEADSTGSLLAPEVIEVLAESQQALVLMKESCADHPLFTQGSISDAKLQWESSWEAITKLQIKAYEYETNLKEVILGLHWSTFSLLSEAQPQCSHRHVEQLAAISLSDLANLRLEAPSILQTALGNEVARFQDHLCIAITSALSTADLDSFDSHPDLDQSISLSLMPLLTSQHRLLSYSILSLLFETHDLRIHLQTQNRFQLLGDAMFASRLSHALFDSSESSGEGRRRKGGHTGLRLQSRDTWPPASSELRLVLLGILSESIPTGDSQIQRKLASRASTPLLESLSFAIRDLSDEDLEKCRDADTIHALDFLALQYKPPTHLLESVITSRSLKVYDDIFVHLLRLLRLKSTAQELVRSVTCRGGSRSIAVLKDRKMRLEMHHFISTLANWAQNTAIGSKWASFAATLNRVEEVLKKRDYDGVLLVGRGLDYIKSLHESVVDDIARSLFLKKKYKEVRAVLDDTFNIVLQLVKHIRIQQSSESGTGDGEMIQQLYESFRKHVRRFLTYLRSNSNESRDQSDSRGPEALMEQLALRLDMYGYYTEKT
jgi:hypothetical protein